VENIGVDFDEAYLKERRAELILIEKPYEIYKGVIASGQIPRK